MEKLKMFDPQEAYILTKTGSKGGKTYQLMILTPFGDFALLSHVSYQDNQEVTFKINDFINSGQTSLSVQQNQRNSLSFLILFILIMMAMPTAVNYAAFFATSPVTTCTFYKSINKVFIERKSLRGNQVIEHLLENILRLDIQEKQLGLTHCTN
ncbi:MAG: hypothetical protein V7K38_14080 [Nostoc sp.]|uniref:hypothetical protein n=1 Tax=Nostoc sp. TaxID=1180 RepID=UPI002FF8BDCF